MTMYVGVKECYEAIWGTSTNGSIFQFPVSGRLTALPRDFTWDDTRQKISAMEPIVFPA